MSERLKDSIDYIKALPGKASWEEKLRRHATRIGTSRLVEKWLKFPIGTEEKLKTMIPSFLPSKIQPENPKDKAYRKAARALLLVELLYDYHGMPDVNVFLIQRRAAISLMQDEQTIQAAIIAKLNSLQRFQFTSTTYRIYDDRNSTAAPVSCNALGVNGQQTGLAPAMLNPRGKWWHHPMRNSPGIVRFAEKQNMQGIFTTSASGGCIAVVFLYGGKIGQALKAASLVHIPGGHFPSADWNKMAFGDKQPTSIVVFLSTQNNLGDIDDQSAKALTFLTEILSYSEQLVLFHICSSSVNHGVDKWGNFGSAFAPGGRMPVAYDNSSAYEVQF
jgi:hypothetical protein